LAFGVRRLGFGVWRLTQAPYNLGSLVGRVGHAPGYLGPGLTRRLGQAPMSAGESESASKVKFGTLNSKRQTPNAERQT